MPKPVAQTNPPRRPASAAAPLRAQLVAGERAEDPALAAFNQAQKGLNTGAVPSPFARYTPLDLYQRFLATGLDYQGQLASGYGQVGKEVLIGAWFDFGDLVAPGILSLPVGAQASGSGLKSVLFVLHRMPTGVDGRKWSTNSPLCFLAMQGKRWNANLTAEASVEAELSIAGIDELGLTLGASLKTGITVSYLRLVDQTPRWYSSATATALRNDFGGVLGDQSKHALKLEIVDWLEKRIIARTGRAVEKKGQTVAQSIKKTLTSLFSFRTSTMSQLAQPGAPAGSGPLLPEGKLAAAAQNILDETKSKTEAALAGAVNKQVNAFVEAASDSEFLTIDLSGATTALLGALKRSALKSAELLDDLDTLRGELVAKRDAIPQNTQDADKKRSRAELDDDIKQIDWYRTRLKAAASAPAQGKTIGQAQTPGLVGMCHVDALSSEVFAEAGAEATLSVEIPLVDAGVSGSASANLKGTAKWTSYRFQSAALSSRRSPLLMTQDTFVTYRQVVAGAAAELAASIDLDVKELKKSLGVEVEKALYNMMTYTSAVAYWEYPTAKQGTVTALPRSGVRFGSSVLLKRLTRYALKQGPYLGGPKNDTPKPNDKAGSDPFIKGLSAALHIAPAQLDQFIRSTWVSEAESDELNASVVLLESSFAFPPATSLSLQLRSAGSSKPSRMSDLLKQDAVKNLLQQVKDPSPAGTTPAPTLQSVRVRVRAADTTSSSTPQVGFRLGFTVKASFQLSRLEEAGRESVIDLDTYWFDSQLTTSQLVMSQENGVPPVALLHQ